MDQHKKRPMRYRHLAAALTIAAITVAGVVIQVETVAGVAAKQRLKVGGAVRPPTKVVGVKPTYPEDAKAAHIEGVVILGIVIGDDGSVIETTVLRSIPDLDQAAVDAVTQWEFEPTLLNGEPVEIEMTITVNFTLQ
jgi:TonB family protein